MRRILVAMTLAAIGLAPVPAAAQTSTYTCFGEPATVVGTPGNDEIDSGFEGVAVGLSGSDDVTGRFVCAGKGDDTFVAGFMVDAGPGDDGEIRLRSDGVLAIGGDGNDDFVDDDGDQRQVWRGGTGNDRFTPAAGDDVFYGGTGIDSIGGGEPGWSNKLRLFGGPDNDRLFAGSATKAKLYGEDGDDWLRTSCFKGIDGLCVPNHRSDADLDLADGGPGFDTCLIGPGDRAVHCEDVTVVE